MPSDPGREDLPRIELRPMAEDRFAAWTAESAREFGDQLARAASLPPELTRRQALTQFAAMMPDGVETAGMSLMLIHDGDGAEVGILWTGPHPQRPDTGYVYDIEIHEDRRGEGLGRAAMLAAERLMSDAGLTAVGLNVFGFNDRAQGLYESLGYGVVSTQMLKLLDRPPA
jgi:ribosomal protein S18 acetylase RimI-like enzyme